MESFEIKSNTNVLGKALKEVLSIASEYDLEIFLNYGALLGFEREGRLLPWNNDVELGLKLEKDRLSQIREFMDHLDLEGFNILFHQYCGTISISKKDVDININFYWKTDEYWVRPHDTAAKAKTSNWLANKVYWISALLLIKNFGSVSFKHNHNPKSFITILIGKLPDRLKVQLYIAGTRLSNILGGRQSLTAIPHIYFSCIESVEFLENSMLAPKQRKMLLEFIYGEGWEVPKQNWSFYEQKNQSVSRIVYIPKKLNILEVLATWDSLGL